MTVDPRIHSSWGPNSGGRYSSGSSLNVNTCHLLARQVLIASPYIQLQLCILRPRRGPNSNLLTNVNTRLVIYKRGGSPLRSKSLTVPSSACGSFSKVLQNAVSSGLSVEQPSVRMQSDACTHPHPCSFVWLRQLGLSRTKGHFSSWNGLWVS